jgi:hypothetical protein
VTVPLDGSKTTEFIMASVMAADPEYSQKGYSIYKVDKGTNYKFDYLRFYLPSWAENFSQYQIKAFSFCIKNNGDDVINIETCDDLNSSCPSPVPHLIELSKSSSSLDQRRRFDYIAGKLIELIHQRNDASYDHPIVALFNGETITFKYK